MLGYERKILAEIKKQRPKAKWSDVMEWSTAPVEIREDEELIRIWDGEINIALKKKN